MVRRRRADLQISSTHFGILSATSKSIQPSGSARCVQVVMLMHLSVDLLFASARAAYRRLRRTAGLPVRGNSSSLARCPLRGCALTTRSSATALSVTPGGVDPDHCSATVTCLSVLSRSQQLPSSRSWCWNDTHQPFLLTRPIAVDFADNAQAHPESFPPWL